jgi:hypothetical protein
MRALRLGSLLVFVAGCSATDKGASPNNPGSPDSGSTNGAGNGNGNGNGAGNGMGSSVVADGYVSAGPWQGYGFTATDPGAATITPNCSASCTPPFSGGTFCMQGKVTGRPDYSGFAMLGWNVNQAMGAGTAMATWPVPATGGLAVTVSNPGATALRVQLQGTNPHDGSDRWCAALQSGQSIPWGNFKTNCWDGGTPQNPLTPGTMIQQASIIVPGLVTDLPFDLCLLDIQIQP